MKKRKLSAFIPVQNVEDIITECLESIKWVDEIFIVDAHSTDKTLEICGRYPNAKIVQHEYKNSGAQRSWGMPQVTHDWVFIIDSDERCNEELRKEIEKILETEKIDGDGFWVSIKTRFLGKLQNHDRALGHTGMRLVRKKTYKNYVLKKVHSKLIVLNSGKIKNKNAFIVHEPIRRFSSHFKKMIRYAEWSAQEMYENGIRTKWYHFVFRPFFKFIVHYFIKLGFLDGMRGLILCQVTAISVFMKYYKLYFLSRKMSEKRSKSDI
jgi:glycosyltransferase involved in cell wall biosynthesis